jgi:nucleoside-diphosphate-sugar epimerase
MTRTKKVLLTGAPGIIGSPMAPRLLAAGYDVTTVSLERWPAAPSRHVVADLRVLGQAMEVMTGVDAVVHLAAVHKGGIITDAETFTANLVSTFNVMHGAGLLRIPKVVLASSTHTAGAWWSADFHPEVLPINESEQYRIPDTYGLSKYVIEQLMRFQRAWLDTQYVALRYGYTHEEADYAGLPAIWAKPESRAANLWNYVDGRDVAQITMLALESRDVAGEVFNVTAADTIMNIPSRELVAKAYPGARLRNDLEEFGTLYSIDHARKRLGYAPRHSWRDHYVAS